MGFGICLLLTIFGFWLIAMSFKKFTGYDAAAKAQFDNDRTIMLLVGAAIVLIFGTIIGL